ncbi:MAG: glycine cleavage system protein GcvH [Candidatus Krumholzibacteria bacterium]|nr:glycine cleavage system protein GcvH [Candidatus Krumholzibacteria bacterium]MDH4337509.1 glycine cleavage system protein GcvH [Candidatus Krumholzibacteria bacterium]MDH5268324.1 glycine cleavage system protein GcvH [Candidatus Krumholzibacteria bacterium]
MDFKKVRFTKDHEWVRLDGGDEVTIGITDFASGELGDIVYVELPSVGDAVSAAQSMGTIEAVKTVADLFAPVSGVVTAVNGALEQGPDLVNKDPFGDGWFVRMKITAKAEFEALMDHAAYQEMIGK